METQLQTLGLGGGRAIEDGKNTARRAVKHGYRATEDFVDDTTHRIKRDPLRADGAHVRGRHGVGLVPPAPATCMTVYSGRPRRVEGLRAEDDVLRSRVPTFRFFAPAGSIGSRRMEDGIHTGGPMAESCSISMPLGR
jgi:hypothetical protein